MVQSKDAITFPSSVLSPNIGDGVVSDGDAKDGIAGAQ